MFLQVRPLTFWLFPAIDQLFVRFFFQSRIKCVRALADIVPDLESNLVSTARGPYEPPGRHLNTLGVHVSLFARALLQSLLDVFLYLLTYHLPRQVPCHGTVLYPYIWHLIDINSDVSVLTTVSITLGYHLLNIAHCIAVFPSLSSLCLPCESAYCVLRMSFFLLIFYYCGAWCVYARTLIYTNMNNQYFQCAIFTAGRQLLP